MCKQAQDFLETNTVKQLPNPPYSPDLSPIDVFLFALLNTFSPDIDISLKRFLAVPLFSVKRCVQKVYLSAFRAWFLTVNCLNFQ